MMNQLLKVSVLGLALLLANVALADEGYGKGKQSTDFAPVTNKAYAEECSACHMAYPPGALPSRSWQKLMGGLNDHFGENAELAAEQVKEIADYLVKNAADHSSYRRSAKMIKGVAATDAPLRISELPYFVREHRGIAKRIRGNEKVKSISQCDSCHTKASTGSYNEHEINVPGIGRVED